MRNIWMSIFNPCWNLLAWFSSSATIYGANRLSHKNSAAYSSSVRFLCCSLMNCSLISFWSIIGRNLSQKLFKNWSQEMGFSSAASSANHQVLTTSFNYILVTSTWLWPGIRAAFRRFVLSINHYFTSNSFLVPENTTGCSFLFRRCSLASTRECHQ